MMFFCFKQKTAYEMRISDWSSDVCSSDLQLRTDGGLELRHELAQRFGVQLGVQLDAPVALLAREDGLEEALIRPAVAFHAEHDKIGRESWRERVCQYVSITVVAVLLQKKNKSTI